MEQGRDRNYMFLSRAANFSRRDAAARFSLAEQVRIAEQFETEPFDRDDLKGRFRNRADAGLASQPQHVAVIFAIGIANLHLGPEEIEAARRNLLPDPAHFGLCLGFGFVPNKAFDLVALA